MNLTEKPPLLRVYGAVEPPTLSSLKTAEEVASLVRMSADRLRELAAAQIVPHFRVDDGPPLFNLPGLKEYVRRYLTAVCQGEPLPLNLRPVVQQPPAPATIPRALAEIESRVCELPSLDYPPCVYFLVLGVEIVYVGQSRNLPARLAQHREDGKRWERVFYLPAPAECLLQVESQWIKVLQPPLNRAGRQSRLTAQRNRNQIRRMATHTQRTQVK